VLKKALELLEQKKNWGEKREREGGLLIKSR
jgi:hypothetical protein